MEGLHSGLTTGELPGGQEHPSHPESPQGDPQPKSPSPAPAQRRPRQQQAASPQKLHGTPRPTKQPRRTHPQRKRLKHQQRSVESDAMMEGSHAEEAKKTTTTTATTTAAAAAAAVAAAETTTTTKITSKVTRVPGPSSGVPVCSATGSVPADQETPEGGPKLKRERKPPRPGKYVCSYCGRACAKPSVLQKHIRSHTGERPYPCAPCGFSFKTKSNLYKHRKSHTHRVKAGLAFPETRSLEEPGSESEDEAKQCPSSAAGMERQSSTASAKSHESDRAKDLSGGGMDDSFAVKKRLAMRLSRGKRGPLDSSEDRLSSSLLGSRGSTESGYFSRSESTEQTQDSPPNTSAKSYAEIILGKYGRLGHLQRMSRQQNQQLSGEEEKNIPFTVPKKQVIDHITKLITINEAVVDTSKIDSVKPRRFSLSRKASSESQKSVNIKEPVMDIPKSEEPSYKNSGSITMGVPCERFQSLKTDPLAPHTTPAPLLRSQSMPFTTSSLDASSHSPPRFRQSQSFEQQTPSQLHTSRRFGMLRRQPAIEIPLSAELPKEDHCSFHSFHPENLKTTVPDHTQTRLQRYTSEACGTECKTWEGYKPHKQGVGSAQNYGNVSVSFANQKDHPKVIIHHARPAAQAMRKRRKEESLESDDPSSSPVACPSPSHAISVPPPQCREESAVAHEDTRRPKPHTLSVIQHTSSFEKQDTSCAENARKEPPNASPTRQDHLTAAPQKPPHKQPPADPTPRNLVHPPNVRVPEILVTEDSNMDTQSSFRSTPASKQPEKLEEFQWPQRSPTLAQLPIEKLPPKKKRLRLAELAQSSGESSFDSGSLPPRSPSQDSSASYASSRSASFEESGRGGDPEASSSATPLRRSRAAHTLAVPGVHPHREMRRSASEQAPHDAQQGALMNENRSKSFDYSCLSPERSAVGWRERRKCLLLKHSAVRDPEEEVEEKGAGVDATTPSARLFSGLVSASAPSSSDGSSSAANHVASEVASPSSGDIRVSGAPARELFSQWKLSRNIQLTGRSDLAPFDGAAGEGSSAVQTGHPPGLPPRCVQHYPGTQGLSGAARAHYLPMSTGLKLEIPSQTHREYYRVQASPLPTPVPSPPNITVNQELLRPLQSPAVAVRLQADTFVPACAIYTTQSQAGPPGSPLRPTSVVPYIASVATSTARGRGNAGPPESPDWSEDLLRPPGTGGSKRMLSPSNSIEFSPESQQQQKRVKEEQQEQEQQEEEEEDGEERDKALVDAANRQRPAACSPVKPIGASCLSLESSTSNSWCYLNYMKPNPFALDERRPSVYSTWSTGSYNPNPPGLSSRTALSLLQCKQSLGPTIYTTSPMGLSSVEPIRAEDHQRPTATEVSSSLSCDREHASTREEALSAEDRRSNKRDEEEREEEEEEGPNQAAKYRHPSQPWTCGEGSSQQSGLVYNRGGHGNLTKHTKVPGKTHYNEAPPPHHTDQGVCDGASFDHGEEKSTEFPQPPPQERSGTSDINNNNEEEEEDRDDDADVKGCRRVPPTSPTNQNAGEPGGGAGGSPTRTPSAGSRRALFARRQLSLRTPPPPPPPETPPPRTATPSPDRLPATGAPATWAPACTRSSPGLPRPHSPPPFPPTRSPTTSPGLQIHPSPVGGASPFGGQSLSYASLAGSAAPTHPPPRVGAAAGIRTNTQADRTLPCLRPDALPPPPRSPPGLLSHLPLHSQQPADGAPTGLTIAIGGIHMIQPRRAPPYRPTCDPGGGGGGGGDRRPSPLRGLEQEEEQEEEEEEEEAGPSPSHGDALPCGKARATCAGTRIPGGRKPPRFWRESEAGALTRGVVRHVAKRCVQPETKQGDQPTPAGQAQL